MELNLEASDAPVRASASVVLLRDGAGGLEVFLLQRHGLSDVLGGAYVFPGGKVDPLDAEEAMHLRLDRSAAQLQAALHEPELTAAQAAAIFVAALRETFEETGLLFARGAGADTAARARQLVGAGHRFGDALALLSLTSASAELVAWSRWITPAVGGVMRKRFDTRFFLARVPLGQQPRHDDHETTASVWLAPREALQRYWQGEIQLAPPQIMSLAHLSRHRCTDAALAEARSRRPPLVHPEPFEQDGVRVICYPGDARHSIRERALPGPTRLHHVAGRFEPAGGFDALFTD